jgi:hypothetical protein
VVDHAPAIANFGWSVLPEIIPHPRASPTVIAQQDGACQMFGAGQQRR